MKLLFKKSFKVYPSLHIESKEGWIWLEVPQDYMENFITIKNNNKAITCMLRTIDDNFIKIYKNNTGFDLANDKGQVIIISEYYRNKLNINKRDSLELEVYYPTCFEKYISVYWGHPNPFISVGIKLGFISILLGIISLRSDILTLFEILLRFIWAISMPTQ